MNDRHKDHHDDSQNIPNDTRVSTYYRRAWRGCRLASWHRLIARLHLHRKKLLCLMWWSLCLADRWVGGLYTGWVDEDGDGQTPQQTNTCQIFA